MTDSILPHTHTHTCMFTFSHLMFLSTGILFLDQLCASFKDTFSLLFLLVLTVFDTMTGTWFFKNNK